MKNMLLLVPLLGAGFVMNLAAAEPKVAEEKTAAKETTKINALEVSAAAAQLVGAIGNTVAVLIPLVKDFPDRIKPQLVQLKEGILYASALPAITEQEKKNRELAVQELFLLSVNMLVEVNNIAGNIFKVFDPFGKLVTVLDKEAGTAIANAVDNVASALYAVTLVSKGMSTYIRNDLNKQPQATDADKGLKNIDVSTIPQADKIKVPEKLATAITSSAATPEKR